MNHKPMVSILGDSISTFAGYNPEGYAAFYTKERHKINGITTVYDTWWAKVNQALGAYLCENNSYSGSTVTGGTFPSASCLERLKNLRTAQYVPDIILISIGFNDFGHGVRLFSKKLFFTKPDFDIFEDAYHEMLARMQSYYPDTKIICGTLVKTRMRDDMNWQFPNVFSGEHFDDYNHTIRKVCRKQRCDLADLAESWTTVETLDGSH